MMCSFWRKGTSSRLLPLFLGTLLLAGCSGDSWWGASDEEPPLPGKRIAVLRLDDKIKVDPSAAQTPFIVPESTVNTLWPQAGGYPDHVMGNLALSANPTVAWRASAGHGSDKTLRVLARPIVADGVVYTLDASYVLTALKADTGKQLWEVSVAPPEESGEALGGGIAYAGDRLIVATGFAEVLAIDPKNGGMIWRKHVAGPVRGAPTVTQGRVFVTTIDNQLLVLSTDDGTQQWAHTGIIETASILGTASPAVANGVVVVPYSSGELFALRVENGRTVWTDNLTAIRRVNALAGLADIRGLPVIDRGLVFATSHSGRTVAIDMRSGARVWDEAIGGLETPYVVDDAVFMLTNDNQFVALTRTHGQVRWVASLDRWTDPKEKTGAIVWTGPVMAGGLLWIASNQGELLGFSPEKGKEVKRLTVGDSVSVPPIVANETLYLLTDRADLIAVR